jgi:predicted permease
MNIFRQRRRKEEDLDNEISSHLEEAVSERIERGETPEVARANALREFGNVGLIKEVTRDMWGWRMFERLGQDLRFALRSIRKHALLSLAVIATLTLGIGVSTGVFTWFNASALRPRIDNDYATFVRVYAAYTDDPARFVIPRNITLEDYLAFRDGAKSLRALTALGEVSAPFGQDDPAVTRAALVTCNFFELYDPGRPLLGRLLQPEDCAAANPVVVLSERLWRHRFAADPQALGRVTHFNGQPVTIVGVTKNFAGMVNGSRAWFPYSLETYLKAGDHLQYPGESPWLDVTARLQPGYTREQAAAELGLLAGAQNRQHPGRSTTVFVTDGSDIQEPVHGRQTVVGVFVLLLSALTVFVLIVCVNVTALLLARAAARQQEIAVRVALGAGRLRLIRMLLIETLLLASVAGLASVYLAYKLPGILGHWLTNARGEGGGTWYSLAPDWRVFGYLMLATMLAGVMAGLTPALQSLKINLTEMLKGRHSLAGGKGSRFYGILIGAQVALSMFLLAGAVLFIRTTQKAVSFTPGFEPQRVLVAQAHPPQNSAENSAQHLWENFHRDMNERLTNLPGVQSVAWAYWSPVYVGIGGMNVAPPGQQPRRTAVNTVSADYFATLGIPLLSGRALRQDDQPCDKGPCSIVVSERLARLFWPNEQPLGKTLKTERDNTYEVVGVVRDLSSTRLGGLDDPIFYRPWNPNSNEPANAFVRFARSEAAITRDVLETYRAHAPELPIEAMTLQSLREHGIESMNRLTQLVVFLCAGAVILALAGIYGVVAFAVSRRTKEMGIRLALGARPLDIYRATLGSSGRPVAIGLALGLALTTAAFFGLAKLVQNNQEFDVNVWDPFVFVVATTLLVVASSVAMFWPAKRATKVDPLIALRDE